MRERVGLKSPVRENCTPGSVRGASGNRRPYRDDSREPRLSVRANRGEASPDGPSACESSLPENGGTSMASTKEEVAEAVRAWCQAWHTHDIETLLALEATAFGFGFRTFPPRDHGAGGEAGLRELLEQWF